MALAEIHHYTGTGLYYEADDVDTDRIIPARFMKCVTFDGLGEFFFYDVRKNEDGTDKVSPFNDPRFAGSSVLVSGRNFGCGSSREHAPQAIYRAGYRAVIAENFAEIFFGNSTTLSLPCVTASAEDIAALGAAIQADPKTEITIDLDKMEIRYNDIVIKAGMPLTAQKALTSGHWDAIADLIEGDAEIDKTAATLPYMAAA
jgi:3-isopropylmalate/(R)-2-methylmalate dehydratase small subunit